MTLGSLPSISESLICFQKTSEIMLSLANKVALDNPSALETAEESCWTAQTQKKRPINYWESFTRSS